MKQTKFVFCVTALLLCLTAGADQRSAALLSKLSGILGGYRSYQTEFRVDLPAGQGGGTIEGKYIVSGDKYYISVEDRKVYCNGKVKYEVNHTDKEVLIDDVNPNDRNILSNPTRAFEFLDGSFTHTYGGETTFAGKTCDVVQLFPVDKGLGLSEVTLLIDRAAGLPAGLKYRVEGSADPIAVRVVRMAKLPAVQEAVFTFDKGRYKGYEMIDFR